MVFKNEFDDVEDKYYRRSPLSESQYEMFEPAQDEGEYPYPEDGFGLYLFGFGAACLITLGLVWLLG